MVVFNADLKMCNPNGKYLYVHAPDPDLTCSWCHEPYLDPVEHPDCSTTLGRLCMLEWLHQHRTPEPERYLVPNLQLRATVDALPVHCPSPECHAEIPRAHLAHHLARDCLWTPAHCRFPNCRAAFPLPILMIHQAMHRLELQTSQHDSPLTELTDDMRTLVRDLHKFQPGTLDPVALRAKVVHAIEKDWDLIRGLMKNAESRARRRALEETIHEEEEEEEEGEGWQEKVGGAHSRMWEVKSFRSYAPIVPEPIMDSAFPVPVANCGGRRGSEATVGSRLSKIKIGARQFLKRTVSKRRAPRDSIIDDWEDLSVDPAYNSRLSSESNVEAIIVVQQGCEAQNDDELDLEEGDVVAVTCIHPSTRGYIIERAGRPYSTPHSVTERESLVIPDDAGFVITSGMNNNLPPPRALSGFWAI